MHDQADSEPAASDDKDKLVFPGFYFEFIIDECLHPFQQLMVWLHILTLPTYYTQLQLHMQLQNDALFAICNIANKLEALTCQWFDWWGSSIIHVLLKVVTYSCRYMYQNWGISMYSSDVMSFMKTNNYKFIWVVSLFL